MDKQEVHVKISGRVQGVFFRATAQAVAERLKLTGFVRNLPDGSIEMAILGTEEEMNDLIKKITVFNSKISIDRIEVTLQSPTDTHTSFEIRH